MARHIHVYLRDDWSENKHPRGQNGEFGSGSGGGRPDDMASLQIKEMPKFVHQFGADYPTGEKKAAALLKTPEAKLRLAYGGLRGHIDPSSTDMRKRIESAAKERGITL